MFVFQFKIASPKFQKQKNTDMVNNQMEKIDYMRTGMAPCTENDKNAIIG